MQVNAQFDGGLNAQAAPDKIAPNEIAAGVNVDFSLQEGALVSRRGSRRHMNVGTSPVHGLYRNYNNPNNYGASPTYASTPTVVYRATNPASPSAIITGTGAVGRTAFGWWEDETLIAHGPSTHYYKDDGTNVKEWVLQSPATPLTVTIGAQPVTVLSTNWVVIEGDGTSTAGVGTATNSGSGRVEFRGVLLATNLSQNGGNSVGDYGIDMLDISFSDPKVVTKISRDFSIGDTNFTDYWHTEMDIRLGEDAQDEGEALLEGLRNVDEGEGVDLDARTQMLNEMRTTLRAPQTRISNASGVYNLWAVPRSKYELITRNPAVGGWENIQAVRIIVEHEEAVEVKVKAFDLRGSEGHPLNDANVGYAWWETWATIDTDGTTVLDESAPSPISGRYRCQFSQATLVSTSSPSGGQHGLTHRRFYRQGGYLRDPYFVGQAAIGTATFTDTVSDIQALNNPRLVRGVHSRASMPGGVQAISEPYFDRVFVGYENVMMWSQPLRPSQFRKADFTMVSQFGDQIQSIVNWMPSLVIVNRDSVYEFMGNVFEGPQADWALHRTGARRGSKAPRVCIKTPYGIPLLDYDGLFMYVPGQGLEQEVAWLHAKIGDAWRGEGSADPATLAGSRIPPINKGYIMDSFAVFADGLLYLAVPTGSSTVPNTLFVIDFGMKRVWYYTYPFGMRSGMWDADDNKLLVGTTLGNVMQLNIYTNDVDDNNTPVGIQWQATTRTWSWPAEGRMTNLSLDNAGLVRADAIYNGTTTHSLVTRTNTMRDRFMPTMNGSLANTVAYKLEGTTTTSNSRAIVFGVDWEFYPEPPKVLYHRTEYFIPETEVEYLGLTSELDCLSGTVVGTQFVDGEAKGTFTYLGTSGPQGYYRSVPQRTTGRATYVEYRSPTPFRHYRSHYETHPEPPRVTFWRTEYEIAQDEQEWKALACQLDCLGATVLATCFIDNVATATYTFTGTGPKGYVEALPKQPATSDLNHPYGRSAYVIYESTSSNQPFKHYATWFESIPEPSRVNHFRTPTVMEAQEQEWRNLKCELNCFDTVVTGVVFVEGTAISTQTFTGSGYKPFVRALPTETYGRSAYTIYTCPSGKVFKHYYSEFDKTPEPPRIQTVRTQTFEWPMDVVLKTWVARLNTYGTPVTGVVRVDGTGVTTHTFTCSTNTTVAVGLDINPSMVRVPPTSTVDVVYSAIGFSPGGFKHYDTQFDVEPTPFKKKTWQVTYRKLGGASQLDRARFWSMDVEAPVGTATITSIWEVDGYPLTTNTLVVSGRKWFDRVEVPPASRGQLFSQRLLANVDIKVWSANLDIQQVGVKGLSRRSVSGVISNE